MFKGILQTESEQTQHTNICYRCKQTFAPDQLIGRRYHRYCRRCFWIDTAQMILTAIVVFAAIMIGMTVYVGYFPR
jgi:hypothetical protein